jgi:hypothetical protein
MGQTPDELRRDIDDTREHLGDTLGAIEDRVSPRAIVERRRSAMAERWTSTKEAVMGRADQITSTTSETAHNVTATASEAMHDAPHMATDRVQGNPWAAGIIAFGAGLLAATLLPVTRTEEERSDKVMDKAKPLIDEAKGAASDIASDMKDESRSHVDALKADAADAAAAVSDTARSAGEDTRDAGRSAVQDVRQTTTGTTGTT